jgi:predicted RNA-binding Zn ribbon-like protein
MGSNFNLIADFLCLDFANTVTVQRGKEVDLITNFPDLAQFTIECNVFSPAMLSDFNRNWSTFDQNRVLLAARDFRSRLREMAEKISLSQLPDATTLQDINEMLAHQSGYSKVVQSGAGYELRQYRDFDRPEHLLVPLAESAALLLCEGGLNLVKKCSNPECGLFFYDTTRNHARRWCSMQICGNRMKVNSYWQRKQQNGNML